MRTIFGTQGMESNNPYYGSKDMTIFGNSTVDYDPSKHHYRGQMMYPTQMLGSDPETSLFSLKNIAIAGLIGYALYYMLKK